MEEKIIRKNKVSRELNITQYDFINPPTAVKIHTWWHWIDGVHTNDEITKVMKLNRDKAYLRKLILPVSPYI